MYMRAVHEYIDRYTKAFGSYSEYSTTHKTHSHRKSILSHWCYWWIHDMLNRLSDINNVYRFFFHFVLLLLMLPNVTHEPLKLCHSHFPFNELNCEQRHIDTNTCMHACHVMPFIYIYNIHALFMFARILFAISLFPILKSVKRKAIRRNGIAQCYTEML